MRYSVIGGYLGAGKTTLLNRMLRENAGTRFGLLINDFGEINIDADLVESRTESQINLTNGCVCCTLVDGFSEAIEQLCGMNPPPEHLLVEASGVADVMTLAQYGHAPGLSLDGVLVLADAETLIGKANDKYVAATVRRQLAAADLVILNKADLVSAAVLDQRIAWLRENFQQAVILPAVHADVPVAVLTGVHGDDGIAGHQPTATAAPPDHPSHERYASWRFESGASQCPDKLARFVDALDDTVIRAKGFAASDQGEALVVQAVGSRRTIDKHHDRVSGTRLVAIGLAQQLDVQALDLLAAQFLAR